MVTMMRMLDLFSGLGGASQPFVDAGWDVTRIEISPLCAHVPHTHILDILTDDILPFILMEPYDLIWASPPCTEFSLARQPQIKEPSLELIERTLGLIALNMPVCHIIENVMGAVKHFRPLMGGNRQQIGPFCFWGSYPLFHADISSHSKFTNDPWSSDPLRPQKRAYVPAPIGEALLKAIMTQTSLLSF